MKSYIQGIIIGSIAVASIFVFMGQTTLDKQIIDQLKELESLQSEIDILGKSMSESFNEVPNVKLASNDNQAILQLNKKFDNLEQKLVSIFQNLDSKIERTIVSTEDNNGILQDIYTDGLPCNK
jgi:vacuolar-type H+-ATPase subunit I/STV1|tara:strand:- start:2970 stop:3341 length:372 start_codon:yes stop_codon:yes gene_type:complete